MKAALTMIALATALAGCGGPTAGGGSKTDAGTPTDPIEVKINALSPPMRDLTFFRAIFDAQYACKQIVKIEKRPRDNGKPVWRVTCDDGGDYLITLQPGGVFTVSGVPNNQPRFKSARRAPAPAAER